jgi:hypothetical protein
VQQPIDRGEFWAYSFELELDGAKAAELQELLFLLLLRLLLLVLLVLLLLLLLLLLLRLLLRLHLCNRREKKIQFLYTDGGNSSTSSTQIGDRHRR